METPFGRLRFLYVGARDMDQDLAYYRSVLGAERVWHFEAFGARVAAVRLGEGPLFLLADHRPAPSCLPIYEVANIEATMNALTRRGWEAEGEPFEIPNGPCCLFHDTSGNELAIFQDVRPGALEGVSTTRKTKTQRAIARADLGDGLGLRGDSPRYRVDQVSTNRDVMTHAG
jgi:predicted enzyme related to lactoylglutathione lyase